MTTKQNILNLTFQYPVSEKSRWVISGFISSFIFLFLAVFEPFHLWNVEPGRRYFVALCYGLIAFSVIYLNHVIASRYFKKHSISIKVLLIWYIMNTFLTALFSAIFNDIVFNWKYLVLSGKFVFPDTFLHFQYWIFVLFLIPSVLLVLMIRNYRLKNHFLTPDDNRLIKIPQKIIIHAENPANDLEMEASDLIYFTSANNYVDIFYYKEEKVKHIMLRNTLKNVEADLKDYPDFCRCHKGFIVDLKKVRRINRGVSGLKLSLNDIEKSIPVSRGMTLAVRGKIKSFVQ
jgi:hypothetical protein